MRVLVCGGRDFGNNSEREVLDRTLSKLHREHAITEVIHGDARGTDRLAGCWAADAGIKVTAVPADWKRFGSRAGPIRNVEMAAMKPDLVVAFPGGKGTAHMVSVALAAGLQVLEIRV